MLERRPWLAPLIVAAITVPIMAGFLTAGPPLGLALGALAVGVILFLAARAGTGGPIHTLAATDLRRRVLVVAAVELDEAAVAAIRAEGEFARPGNAAEVLIVAPAMGRALDRWATDVAGSRLEAQRKLVLSVAALGKSNVVARGEVGDANLVLAVEDALRGFAATQVILVTPPAGDDRSADRAASELEARLGQPLSRIVVG